VSSVSEREVPAVAKRRDRRVERTQQLLREALLSLIREKGFEGLTVQEIIDRANVGRATFYAHFENKDDLLLNPNTRSSTLRPSDSASR
jgi:AcrR family transcriptional regulator